MTKITVMLAAETVFRHSSALSEFFFLLKMHTQQGTEQCRSQSNSSKLKHVAQLLSDLPIIFIHQTLFLAFLHSSEWHLEVVSSYLVYKHIHIRDWSIRTYLLKKLRGVIYLKH